MYTDYERLKSMKRILDSTMAVETRRWLSHPDYRWIDMKLDAIDNSDHFNDEGIRGRDNIYSWIQGRGLEALVTHIRWYESFHGYEVPDLDLMRKMADTVAMSIKAARAKNGGHMYFRLSEDGQAKHPGDGSRYTMSDLFCSRGLYCYSLEFGTEEDRAEAKEYLVSALESVVDGTFYDDVESFYSGRAVTYSDGRTTFSGNMIALGGATLLVRGGDIQKGLSIGSDLVGYVFDHHLNLDKNGKAKWPTITKYTIVDWIMDEAPARCSNNEVQLNPGHSIEFVGLTAQLFLEALSSGKKLGRFEKWVSDITKTLAPIIKANFRHGYRKPCGMAMLIDAETNEVINDNMAWWGIPETMRALVLVGKLTGFKDPWLMTTYDKCLSGFDRWYFRQSVSGIAIQTINSKGIPQAVIPATPDLDPGYHTGLSFIGCYRTLAEKCSLHIQKGQAVITPERSQVLVGHAARVKPFQSVNDDLKGRILVLHGPYSQSALVSLDLIESDETWIEVLRERFSQILGIPGDSIVFAATHTHTGPSVMHVGAIPINRTYIRSLSSRMVRLARATASQKAIPVKVSYATATTDIGINRRGRDPETGNIIMKPNFKAYTDFSVPVVAFRSEDGAVQAVIFNTAVHPTTIGVDIYSVSADYPGNAASRLAEAFGENCVAIPLTGACGNVRPALLTPDRKSFRDGKLSDVSELGQRLSDAVLKATENAYLSTGLAGSRAVTIEAAVPMKDVPSREELLEIKASYKRKHAEAKKAYERLTDFEKAHDNPIWAVDAEKRWAEILLKKKELSDTVSGKFSVWIINEEIAVFCVPGELFAEIGTKIKSLWKGGLSMLAGYANGSLGYLPSKAAMSEGGYEVSDSYKDQGFAGPFTEELEDILTSTMEGLLEECRR